MSKKESIPRIVIFSKRVIRALATGLFRWPLFYISKVFSRRETLDKLIALLIKQKNYKAAKSMIMKLDSKFAESFANELTPSEENLELERFFWEKQLREKFDPTAVIRLARTYELQGREETAFQFLKLSLGGEPAGGPILSYFSLFCQRYEKWFDAEKSLNQLLEIDPENNIHKRNLILAQMKMKQTEASLSDKASLNNSGQTPGFELQKYSTSISNFFDSLSVRSEVKSNGFPHVVSLTHTEITHDNRVKKIAASIAMRGYRSTLICPSESKRTQRGHVGDADVIKIPVSSELRNRVRAGMRTRTHPPLNIQRQNVNLDFNQQILRIRRGDLTSCSTYNSHRLRLLILASWSYIKVIRISTFLKTLKVWNSTKSLIIHLLQKNRGMTHNHLRSDHLDYEKAFGPIIEKLKPDLIHINDYHLIGVGVTAARNLRKAGYGTKVIYDAHELALGIEHKFAPIWKSELAHFIEDTDGITCVSALQAEVMEEVYSLSTTPTIVANAPQTIGTTNTGPSIKDDLNIDGKILTYHGGATPIRGLETIVRSLEYLPEDVHLALMVSGKDDFLQSLKEIEEDLRNKTNSSRNRLHFLPYVSPERLSHYLSTSDLTIIGLLPISSEKVGNHHIAMPNKLFESIQAKVPIVTSDMPALSSFVMKHKVGAVYEAGSSSHLAEKVAELLDAPIDKESIFTEEFLYRCSWERQIENLFRLYEHVLNELQCPQKNIGPLELEFKANRG